MSKVNDYLKNMAKSRAKVIAKLQNVPDEAMTLPIPNRDNISVRFIFYRLVAHEIEHTIHLAKTVRSLGVHLSEAEQILKEENEKAMKLHAEDQGLSNETEKKEPKKATSKKEVISKKKPSTSNKKTTKTKKVSKK